MIRPFVKNLARSLLLRKKESSVLLASMGRSGSTVLFESAVSTMHEGRDRFFSTRRSLSQDFVWTLKNARFETGKVYKTHDFPDHLEAPDHLKVIYVFGDPLDIVRSVLSCEEKRGIAWIEEHFLHLKAAFEDYAHIFDKDVLRMGDQIDAWLRPQKFRLLTVKYDAIWEHEQGIADFLELPIKLPVRQPRESSDVTISAEQMRKFEATYSEQIERIAKAPAFRILEAETKL